MLPLPQQAEDLDSGMAMALLLATTAELAAAPQGCVSRFACNRVASLCPGR